MSYKATPLPPAASLIAKESSFEQGSVARGFDGRPCGTGLNAKPVRFDCLGALLWAYRKMELGDRHDVCKRVFEACRARFGHTRLGHLTYDDSFELLRDCGA